MTDSPLAARAPNVPVEVLPKYFPKLVPVTSLRAASWNPRAIKGERFKNLCRSMQEDPDFLMLRPILAQGDGTIYAGNQRFLGAQNLGYVNVWAVVEDVPEQVAKERALRDNQQWGDWDEEALADLIEELDNMGSDVTLLGFDEKALRAIRDQPAEGPGGGAAVDVIAERWQVIVECTSEDTQRELIERLTEEGLECRALIS